MSQTPKIGMDKFEISIDTYGNEEGVIDFALARLRKFEIISETPKKFRIKISTLESLGGKLNFSTREKLYSKENVHLNSNASFESVLSYVGEYIKGVTDSEFLSEYRRKFILQELNNIDEAKIIEYFFNS